MLNLPQEVHSSRFPWVWRWIHYAWVGRGQAKAQKTSSDVSFQTSDGEDGFRVETGGSVRGERYRVVTGTCGRANLLGSRRRHKRLIPARVSTPKDSLRGC